MINSAIALLLGIYLVMVVWGDNESKLFSFISQEVGFLKWAAAIVTLSFIINVSGKEAGGAIKSLGILALIALFLGQGDKIFKQIEQIYSK